MADPIRALDPASVRSAAMISGRRRSNAAGPPALEIAGATGIGASAASALRDVPGWSPISTSSAFSALSSAVSGPRTRAFTCAPAPPGLRERELGGDALAILQGGRVDQPLLGFHLAPGDGEPCLEAADRDI